MMHHKMDPSWVSSSKVENYHLIVRPAFYDWFSEAYQLGDHFFLFALMVAVSWSFSMVVELGFQILQWEMPKMN